MSHPPSRVHLLAASEEPRHPPQQQERPGNRVMSSDAVALELRTFCCEDAYAYVVPPARSAAGHRAADWDVDKWLAKVRCELFTLSGDGVAEGAAVVRLHDAASGELFAECPLTVEVPVGAVVEPVVDSSRYFVCRVEDPQSGRHAFVGLGFASRDDSTDFKVALAEVQKARDREREATRRREAHEEQVAAAAAQAATAPPRADLSLPEGAKITVNVPVRTAPRRVQLLGVACCV